jgi:tetratricopeptide (TPR) repeat protein
VRGKDGEVVNRNISYTAAYAEMARYVYQGVEALQQRNAAAAIQNFEHAVHLADTADLGPQALVGSRRNLAIAYRTAGQFADAERVLRQLLAHPALREADRPFVLHGLGSTLALAGDPEAAGVLADALRRYTSRKDALVCALDLAEFWLDKGEAGQAFDLLAGMVGPDDAAAHPDRFTQAQLMLARCALALQQIETARAHLKSAEATLAAVKEPILRSLYRAILAELEFQEGQVAAAQSHCVDALEQGLANAELDSGGVLRTIASVFRKIFHT